MRVAAGAPAAVSPFSSACGTPGGRYSKQRAPREGPPLSDRFALVPARRWRSGGGGGSTSFLTSHRSAAVRRKDSVRVEASSLSQAGGAEGDAQAPTPEPASSGQRVPSSAEAAAAGSGGSSSSFVAPRAHPLLAPHTPLRRLVLVVITFYLGFNTPPGAFQRSLLLGVFAVVCLCRREIMALLSQLAVPPPAALAVGSANATAAAAGAQGDALPRWLRAMSGPQQTAFGVFVYLLAGLCEIGGGWLVWQAVRSGKPWYWALAGSAVLVCYGFVATLQPVAAFARVYASEWLISVPKPGRITPAKC